MEHTTREAWLQAAVEPLLTLIEGASSLHRPKHEPRVSCGWPRADRNGKVIGQCWNAKSGNGTHQMFISPLLDNPHGVLATLLHELIHACDDCANQHKGPFVRACRAVGLAGKPTATYIEPDTELAATIRALAEELGSYPHSKMSPVGGPVKKQSTRMVKVVCEACGYTLRATKKWLDLATPMCPLRGCKKAGHEMVIEWPTEDE